MKTIVKIVVAGLILIIIIVAGCTALVGGAAKEASDNISSAQQSDTAKAKAFAVKFAKVKTGDTISGAGGMTFSQVQTLLGKPKTGDISETKSGGMTLTTWTYTYILSDESSIFSVDFTNGKVSGKTRM
jgi:hypothetical protein